MLILPCAMFGTESPLSTSCGGASVDAYYCYLLRVKQAEVREGGKCPTCLSLIEDRTWEAFECEACEEDAQTTCYGRMFMVVAALALVAWLVTMLVMYAPE